MSPLIPTLSATPAIAANADVAHPDATGDSFWQKPFAQKVLPFMTSLSVHAGVIVAGLLTVTAVSIIRTPAHQEQVVASATELVSDSSSVHFPGYTDDAKSRMTQDQITNESEGTSSMRTDSKQMGRRFDGSAPDFATVMAAGSNRSFGDGGLGLSHGTGSGNGDQGGPLAGFNPPSEGGLRGPMFTTRLGAHRIAFVCDASGSMINKMASLKMELDKAVNTLRPTQSFSIIFFQDTKHPQILDEQLVPATPSNRLKAGTFLDGVTATGTTNPIPGLEAAFRQNPELIFLLTDGDFPENDVVLAKIRELNKARKVRINTIAFVGSNDNDTAFIGLLKTIASENGGSYRHVSEDELGR